MKKTVSSTLVRLLEAAGKYFLKAAAVMFAGIAICAGVCVFTGDGIVALMGAVAGAFCSATAWNI